MKESYDVYRVSSMGGEKRHVSGPHSWPVAWRKASALNKQARKDFAEGRTMYDVPEYVAEKRSAAGAVRAARGGLQIQRVGGAQAEQAKAQGLTKVTDDTARRLWDADVPFFMAGDKVGGHALFGHWGLAAPVNPSEAKRQGATFDVVRNRFVAYLEPELGRHASYFVETKHLTEGH